MWGAQGAAFAIVTGDLIDHVGNSSSMALADLGAIHGDMGALNGDRFYALGNHDQDHLTKAQFFGATGMTSGHYSFDRGGVHFVVLDANYRSDSDSDPYAPGNYSWNVNYVPPGQRAWLEADLAATDLPTLVFCHYRLDAAGGDYAVNNAAAVRSILETSGKVKAVFTGHQHINGLQRVNGIPYCLMMAMTEGQYPTTAYALISVRSDNRVTVFGRGQQWSFGV